MRRMTQSPIQRVGVLGAGIMGTGIACHLANGGVQVVLLDIPPPDGKGDRNAFAKGALAKALKSKPPKPLSHPSRAGLIQIGNLEDDLGLLGSCQWVVEAVKEDLAIKQALFARVESVVGPDTIVSSNTSGLRLEAMMQGRSEAFQQRFLITHFFNPVRYMHLLELVLGPNTDRAVGQHIERFAQDVLGKGVVYAKDTPNFIANRIGTYGMMRALKEMETHDATIEEIDAIFGPAMGRPKSAVFKTGDLVGIDLLLSVAEHCYDGLASDPERDIYKPPAWVAEDLVAEGRLGRKSGAGFYKKVKKTESNPKGLEVWDRKEKSYRPMTKVRIESLGRARNLDETKARVAAVAFADDRAGQIAWPVLRDSLAYAMNIQAEIADDVPAIDDAMRWGFNWELGPFETWDALGFEEVAQRMEKDGVALAGWIKSIRDEGHSGIYAALEKTKGIRAVDPRRVSLRARKAAGAPVVQSNIGASLIDVGDGVFALEFHTKGNAIDADIITMLESSIDYVEAQGKGLVIYNEGENFSFGANLMLIYMLAQQKDWDQIAAASEGLQKACQRIRYARVPVIAAPHNMALGGGCEICLATSSAAGLQPHLELYIGLVEVGVGLIPGAGGNVNTLFGFLERIPEGAQVDPLPMVAQAFQQIALAKVATSVEEARAMGYVPLKSGVSMDRRRQLHDAKNLALGLFEAGYRPPVPRAFRLPGESGIATLRSMVRSMVQSGHASEHDALIASKIAHVLCGGAGGHTQSVTEQQMLDLEREAFVSLCGEPKSLARIEHMLTKNKPLRN